MGDNTAPTEDTAPPAGSVTFRSVTGEGAEEWPVVVRPGPHHVPGGPPPKPPGPVKETPQELVGFVGAANRCLIVLVVVSVMEITVGAAAIMMGDHTATFYQLHTKRHCPALWWTGIFPMCVGILQMIATLRRNPKEISRFCKLALPAVCIHTLAMWFVGAFYANLYSAWPYAGRYNDKPVCQYMVDRCYCQDYFHGPVSRREVPGIQYIHTDIKWKDSLFVSCDDVEVVTRYYFGTMFAYGLFLAVFVPTAVWGVIAGTNAIRPFCVERCLGYESPSVSYKQLKEIRLPPTLHDVTT